MSTSNRYVFVGGPGRSGTSFVASRMGNHPQIANFLDVELKILFERDGLWDLREALCTSYSPNRAVVSRQRFEVMLKALTEGRYGQPVLAPDSAMRSDLFALLDALFARLSEAGHLMPMTERAFDDAAAAFFAGIAEIAHREKPGAQLFLEKTPHNLLRPEILSAVAGYAPALHIIRDPRATAVSLLSQPWGAKTIEQAAAWVASYYDTWETRRASWNSTRLPLREYRIEDIANAPADHAEEICAFLDLDPMPELFDGVDLPTLQRWSTKLDTLTAQQLNSRLGPTAQRLGYVAEIKAAD